MKFLDKPLQINDKRLFVLSVGIFAGFLGSLLFYSPVATYLYSETDFVNLLAAQGYLNALCQPEMDQPPAPFFSFHWVEIGLLKLAIQFGLNSVRWLWGIQTVFFVLFFLSARKLITGWFDTERWGMLLLLLICHPLTISAFFWNPGESLTAFLALTSVYYWQKRTSRSVLLFVSVFLLSFSGYQGFCFAIFLLIYCGFFSSAKWEQPTVLVLFAVLPAGILFILLSLLTGFMGGASFPDTPTFFSSLTINSFFSGTWTENFRDLLFWIANGLVDLTWPVWMFGMLVLLGFFESWQAKQNHRLLMGYIVSILVLWIGLFAFLPLPITKQWFFTPFFVLMVFAVNGINKLSSVDQKSNLLKPLILSFFCILSIRMFLIELPSRFAVSAYTQKIADGINTTVKKAEIPPGERIAIPFIPSIFAHAENISLYLPMNIPLDSLVAGFPEQTPENSFELHTMEMPYGFIFFSSYQKKDKNPPSLEQQDWLKGYTPYYDKSSSKVLSFYFRHKNANNPAGDPFLISTEKMIKIPERENAKHSAIAAQPIGMNWTFESGYQNTVQTGLAFGASPDYTNSPMGLGCAGPGGYGKERLLGTMESIPFTLEGDELQFYAAIPKESTSAIFCLAVYQSEPAGGKAVIQKVRSIFDRDAEEPLTGNTFFYIRPQQLIQQNGIITGWRAVRILSKTETNGWRQTSWDITPWKNKQGVWLAADRDPYHSMQVDHIIQIQRNPGYYWNFEDATYQGWLVSGDAFGNQPAYGEFGNQEKIKGFNGNYFINSFYEGSDASQGTMLSPEFIIPKGKMTFQIGGGDDWRRIYVELTIEGIAVARATGNRSEMMNPVEWNLTSWEGKTGQIHIVDNSSDPWGHILADDFRIGP